MERLIKIAYTDWNIKRIPDKQILLVFLLGVTGIWIMPELAVMEKVIGIFMMSIPLFLLASVVPGSIGGGDIKLMAAGGFLLGAKGIWKAFCIGVVLCSVYVVILLIIKKVNRKTETALGTFLCIGMILVFYEIQ